MNHSNETAANIRPRKQRSAITPDRRRRTIAAAIEMMEPRLLLSNSIIVNSTVDTAVNDSVTTGPTVSLREAVNYENANGGGTIGFDSSLTAGGPATVMLSAVNDSTAGPSDLAIDSTITIVGPTGSSGITIANVGMHRLFYIAGDGNLTLQNLTLSGGDFVGGSSEYGGGAAGMGGAIFNAGTLTIQQSTVEGNTAQGGEEGINNNSSGGGGLGGNGDTLNGGGPNAGTIGLNNNDGGFGGGGAAGSPAGDGGFGGAGSSAGNSGFGGGGTEYGTGGFGGGPVDGGGAGMGGAVFNYGGTVSLVNSTFTNDTAIGGAGYDTNVGQGLGGAIFNLNGTVTSDDSTLAYNTADNGGGAIYSLGDNGISSTTTQGGPSLPAAAASVTLNNSILADSTNSVGDFVSNSVSSGTASTSGTNNLIETAPGNFTPTASTPATLTGDPGFVTTTPAANGGPTDTFALTSTSSALNAGDNAAIPADTLDDQRGSGYARIVNSTVDIGAYELQNSAPTVNLTTTSQAANVTTVIITGSNFDTNAANDSVVFNDGAAGTVGTATSTSLTVTFTTQPTGSGSLTVVVTSDSQSSGAPVQVATIQNAAPVVTQDTDTIPANAAGITITGTNFDPTAAHDSVTFNDGAYGTVTAATDTSLSVSFTTDPTTAGSLTAVVTTPTVFEDALPANVPVGQNSGSPVQVATVIPVVTPDTTTLPLYADGITINGYGFDPTAENNMVVFNDGETGSVEYSSATSLFVLFNTEPTQNGSLTAIVTSNGESSGAAVQVGTIQGPPPEVDFSFNDQAITVTTLTINGQYFDATAANNTVVFNDGAVGTVGSATTSSLTVTFTTQPTTAGELTAVVTSDGQSSLDQTPVAQIIPVVTQNTDSIPADATGVVINGFGFDATAANNEVEFNDGVNGEVTAATATSLSVTFYTGPRSAGSLTVEVTTDDQSSGDPVQVATVGSLAPTVTQNTATIPANAAGITINGSNFDPTAANDSVVFNDGAVGTVTSATATSLSVSFTTDPTTAGSLTAVVTTGAEGPGVVVNPDTPVGQSSGAPVQVATVIPVVTPSTASIAANATGIVINGYGFDPTADNNSITFNNGAVGTVTSATATSLSVSFTTEPTGSGSLTAVVTTDSESSGDPVQIATVAAAPTGSLSGSVTGGITTGYNLTNRGTSDWAQFGKGGNASAFDHKATGGSQISTLTAIGGGRHGGYTSSSYETSWSDGTPLATDGAEHGYVWANNAIGAGYSFTAPADTTTRTLYVYVGGFSSGTTLTAQLSDGSATSYTIKFSGSQHFSDIVAITYTAASANQYLLVTYTKSASNVGTSSGSADLIAAWLVGTANQTKPMIVTNPHSQSVAAGTDVMFSAAATGTPPVTVQWERSVDGGTTFTTIPGATSTTLDIGTTNASENGYEYEALFTNSLGTQATTAATLTVTSPVTTTGSISGTSSVAGPSYNLAQLGTSDWAHWGRGGQATNFDHKAGVSSQISNINRLGSGTHGGYTDSSRDSIWTGGTPASADTGDHGYIWANNAIGAGFSFTVPASTTARTVYVYLGGYSSGSTLTAHLSDSSAPDYVLTLSSSGHYTDVVAITYKAASANQKLTLSYVKSQTIGSSAGSTDLIGAWLT